MSTSSELLPVSQYVFQALTKTNASFEKLIANLEALQQISFFPGSKLADYTNVLCRLRSEINLILVEVIAGRNMLNLKGAYIYLGFLRSREYIRMQRTRREAIQEFWLDYFKLLGGQITFANDGPGLLQDVLGIQPEEQSP